MGKEFRYNIRVSNTLIDTYSRCGRVDFACQIFEQMPSRTLVSWNSMMVDLLLMGTSRRR